MITHMHIENFKCFKDFDIDLGPFNVLIGPNDSGKTAFLQAVQLLKAGGGAGRIGLRDLYVGNGEPAEAFWQRDTSRKLLVRADTDEPSLRERGIKRVVWSIGGDQVAFGFGGSPEKVIATNESQKWYESTLANVQYYRLDPAELRLPCILEAKPDWTGNGLPILLDRILFSDRQRFFALEREFYRRFPHYERLELARTKIQGRNGLCIVFFTRQKVQISTSAVSDGVMLSLAYLAICQQTEQPGILLIEEPETGVHHASLKDTIMTLRQLSGKGVQVILTTHSPDLLQEVEPKDVRVFSKDDEGAVHAVKLSDYPEVEKMQKYFGTGEIWTDLDEKEIVAKAGAGK